MISIMTKQPHFPAQDLCIVVNTRSSCFARVELLCSLSLSTYICICLWISVHIHKHTYIRTCFEDMRVCNAVAAAVLRA